MTDVLQKYSTNTTVRPIKKNTSLQPLHYNDFEPFYIFEANNLLRFGVPSGGSSFFYAIYSWKRDFRSLSAEKKCEFITEERKTIANEIERQEMIENPNFLIQFIDLYKMFLILHKSDKSLEIPPNINLETLKIVFRLIPIEVIQSEILSSFEHIILDIENPTAHDFQNNLSEIFEKQIHVYIDNLERNIANKWSPELRDKIISILLNTMDSFTDFIIQEVVEECRTNISNFDTWLSLEQYLSLVNDDVNIFIIDANTMSPVNIETDYSEKHYSIILLYFPDHHFEILGRNHNHKISRLFTFDEPIIQKLLQFYQ